MTIFTDDLQEKIGKCQYSSNEFDIKKVKSSITHKAIFNLDID